MVSSFAVVDVETANGKRSSICQIGIATFTDGKLVDVRQTLVNPEEKFQRGNVRVHGITADQVKTSPTYPQVADQVRALLENQTVVTYTEFDQDALRKVHKKYGLPFFSCTWLDAHVVVKDALSGQISGGFSLTNVAKTLGIKYQAHDAAEDARATGEVILRVNEVGGHEIDDWVRAYRQPTVTVPIPMDVVKDGKGAGPKQGQRRLGCLKVAGAIVGIILVLGILAAIFGDSEDTTADKVDAVPTYTPTPSQLQAVSEPEDEQVATQAPAPAPPSVPASEIDMETTVAVMSILMAQEASHQLLLELADGLQAGSIEGLESFGQLIAAGAFVKAARDAAEQPLPASVSTQVEAVRSNDAVLTSVISRWMDKEIDSSMVPGLLTELDIEADVVAFGDALRAAGYTDVDMTQMMDQIEANLAELEE